MIYLQINQTTKWKKMWTFVVALSFSLSHSLCESFATNLPTFLAFWSRFFSVERGKINFSRCRCCRLIQVSRNIRWWMCNFFINSVVALAVFADSMIFPGFLARVFGELFLTLFFCFLAINYITQIHLNV